MKTYIKCLEELTEVFEGSAINNQYDIALEIHIHGGYAMFVNLVNIPQPMVIMYCQKCAQELCETNPEIYALLKPQLSVGAIK